LDEEEREKEREMSTVMDKMVMAAGIEEEEHKNWKKVVYGGVQAGYADNYMDATFLEALVMNGNVVKRDTATVMRDSVGIASHVSVVALVATVWTHALNGALPASTLLWLDALVLLLGDVVVGASDTKQSHVSTTITPFTIPLS
jgi:hypothetical protein